MIYVKYLAQHWIPSKCLENFSYLCCLMLCTSWFSQCTGERERSNHLLSFLYKRDCGVPQLRCTDLKLAPNQMTSEYRVLASLLMWSWTVPRIYSWARWCIFLTNKYMESGCPTLKFVMALVSKGCVPYTNPKATESGKMKSSFFLWILRTYQKNLLEAHWCTKNYYCSSISDEILRLENFTTLVLSWYFENNMTHPYFCCQTQILGVPAKACTEQQRVPAEVSEDMSLLDAVTCYV